MGEDRLRVAAALTAFDHTSEEIMVVAVDPDAGYPIVEVNAGFEEAAGRERGDLVGQPLGELQPPEVAKELVRRVDEVLATGRDMHYQVEREVAAGRRTYQAVLCALPDGVSERPHVVNILRDVTALRRVTGTLSEIQEVADIGYWTWDLDADEIRWSRQLYRIFGVDPGAFGADLQHYLACIHPGDRDRVEARIRESVATGERFELEHRVVRPVGETRVVHCQGRPTTGRDGEVVRLTGTAQRVRPGHGDEGTHSAIGA